MTVTEIWLGVPATPAAQQEKLDQGYTIDCHKRGPKRREYVIAHRPDTYRPVITMAMNAAHEVFGFWPQQLIGRRRDAEICRARFAAQWAARQMGKTLPEIGRRFNRDHTTVMDAIRRCEEMQASNKVYRKQCERVMSMVRSA